MKTTTIKPPKGNAMERLHDAARDIVDGVRKAARSTGQKGTANLPVHIPVLMAGTNMRVVIEAGPSIAALQREWLDKNGWAHHLNRAGKPIVGRLYARLRMAGLRPETFVHHGGWTPDFQSIN